MGWFIGANSDAHITLINFKNEFLFELYINQIRIFSILLFQKKLFSVYINMLIIIYLRLIPLHFIH